MASPFDRLRANGGAKGSGLLPEKAVVPMASPFDRLGANDGNKDSTIQPERAAPPSLKPVRAELVEA